MGTQDKTLSLLRGERDFHLSVVVVVDTDQSEESLWYAKIWHTWHTINSLKKKASVGCYSNRGFVILVLLQITS